MRDSPSSSLQLEHVHHQRRHQRPGEEIGREHGKNDRLCQRNEEIAGNAAKQEERHEDDADAERRDERGNGDLLCAIQNRLLDIGLVSFFEDAVDVFDLDRGVVDQNADRQREAA